MRFNAALARRVALILGLSFPAFSNALADGRAVLPPRWMVEAYLSDALVKPSRDDIARAIVPGLGMVPAFLGGGNPYAEAIAAITNKKVWLRPESSSASDGTSIATAPWSNEGSLGGVFNGTGTWKTELLNGYRGIRKASETSGILSSPNIAITTILGTNDSCTIFAVERRTGAQGSGYSSGSIATDNAGYWGWKFPLNQRELRYYHYVSESEYYRPTGISFSDGAPYAVALRVNTSGQIRVNMNGSVFTEGSNNAGRDSAGFLVFLYSGASITGPNEGYEYIVTTDVLSDDVMDAFVLGARWKYNF